MTNINMTLNKYADLLKKNKQKTRKELSLEKMIDKIKGTSKINIKEK